MFQRPLIPILLCFIGGMFFGHMGLSPDQSPISLIFLFIIFILIAFLFIPPPLRSVSFAILFFLTGLLLDLESHHHSDLLSLKDHKEKVIIEGTVLRPPKFMRDLARLELRSNRVILHGKVKKIGEKIQVIIYNHARDFSPGDRIRFPAILRSFKNFNNPGRYDYESAMRLKGFSCAASVSDGRFIVPMGRGNLGFPMEILERVRRPIRDFFRKKLSNENQALYGALILGERHAIDAELREPFNRAGLGHILAVSGLHIGLVAWLTFFLAKRLFSLSYNLALKRDIHRLAAIITCFPVIAYTCIAGLQVSSQRAMIMALAYLFSIILGREKEVWSTLCLAAIIILAIDPHALYSISFQLSFCAVIGILWLGTAIFKKIPLPFKETKQKTIFNTLYLYITGLIVVTFSAMIFLLPITTYYFHRISLVSIVANLTVIPILGLWIIPLGLLSALCLPFPQSIANLFLQLGAIGLEWMMSIIRFWAHFDWAAFWVVTPNIFEMVLFYSLIFFGFFLRRWSWAKIGLIFVLFTITIDITYWIYETRFNPYLKITYLDVGQGNSALIQFPGKERMLIDGGGFSRDHFDVGRMVVAPSLWHSKLNRIDYLVLTHPQADHMNGLRFIASHFKPKEFWYNGESVENPSYKELMNILDIKKTKKLLPVDLKETREISGVKIELLHPLSEGDRKKLMKRSFTLNDNSMVIKISYQGKCFLFPGDLERPGEEVVVANAGSILKSDVMLAPHHGSRTSCSREFLQMVKPRICVVSSGGGNYFGFPHPEILKRLKDIGCEIIRIDQSGAVEISVGPNRFEVDSFLKDH